MRRYFGSDRRIDEDLVSIAYPCCLHPLMRLLLCYLKHILKVAILLLFVPHLLAISNNGCKRWITLAREHGLQKGKLPASYVNSSSKPFRHKRCVLPDSSSYIS